MSASPQFVMVNDEIAAYSEFTAKLATLEKENAAVVFDYEDPKGEKAARSHIHKLRRTKTAVDTARKEEKQQALEYGREVDRQAKEIVARIEAMIEVHQKPLDEIKEREEVRIAGIEERIATIKAAAYNLPVTSDALRDRLNDTQQMVVDESFDEFMAVASGDKKEAIRVIEAALSTAIENEKQQAELEALRLEKEARERAEREERLKAEAAQAAREAAEREAEKERQRIEAEHQAEIAAREAREKAEKERAERAERQAAEAKEAAEREAREREEAARREAEARERDDKHRAKINSEAAAGLVACGVSKSDAEKVVDDIAAGLVAHVTITY